MSSSVRTLNIREMQEIIVDAYTKNPRQNLGFKGPPGCGKTEGIYGAAKVLKQDCPNFSTRVIILSQCESVDMRIPFIYGEKNDRYKFLAHDDLRFPLDSHGILFLDEAANAQADVLKAMQQILSDRCLGDIEIPKEWMIIIASNNKQDRAGVNSIPTAFANRVEWHQVIGDAEQWLEDYAVPSAIDVQITSYIRKFPNCLNNFNPEREINPTSRTWTKINEVLGSRHEIDRISGLIGDEMGLQFSAWKSLWQEFPDQEDIEKAPEKAKLPKKEDAQFALVYAMASWVCKENWSSFYVYMERMNLEYQMMYMKESTRQHPKLGFKDTKEYSKWIVKHQGKLLVS